VIARLKLAWRQMVDGLRGADHSRQLDQLNAMWTMTGLELEKLRAQVHSKRKQVMVIEHVGQGAVGRWGDGDVVRNAIRCRFYDVPTAFMTEEAGNYLQADYCLDKSLMSRDPKTTSLALEYAIKNAAAELGVAMVCGVQKEARP
jgi:hypothetical protein